MKTNHVRTLAVAVAMAAAAGAWAQPVPEGPPDVIAMGIGGDGPVNHEFRLIRAGEGFETRLVKGAPYQAETVTETVQTLADGNRIVHKTTGLVARDGEGRTRREQAMPGFAAFGRPGPPPRTVFIHDSAAGVSYALEPEEKVARKMGRSPLFTKVEEEAEGGPHGVVIRRFERKLDDKVAKAGEPGPRRRTAHKPETEPLGTRTIEGVEAVGSRTTITIPAGEIGNERDIEIVNERWMSPDLKVVVMSRNSDPRFGETTYRLTAITRGEPDRALFEVPSDYTVKEGEGGLLPDMKVRKIIREDKKE
jgi:hypothetical protein